MGCQLKDENEDKNESGGVKYFTTLQLLFTLEWRVPDCWNLDDKYESVPEDGRKHESLSAAGGKSGSENGEESALPFLQYYSLPH